MKKLYSVSLPVYAHVVVFVEADGEDEALAIAEYSALLSDASPIDFSQDEADIVEIESEAEIAGSTVYFARNKYRVAKED
jgi:hypothetical protein